MKNILCYGDSNTWGYDAPNDSRFSLMERWPGILKYKLREEYYVIENGLCGRTTQFESETELFVDGLKGALFCAEVHAPLDYAAIMLGTNDCKAIYAADVRTIRKGIQKIGECFAEKGAQILLISPPVIYNLKGSPFFEEFGKGAEEKSNLLKYEYKQLAIKKGWEFLDADTIVKADEFDRIHLNKKGHILLAKEITRIYERKIKNER